MKVELEIVKLSKDIVTESPTSPAACAKEGTFVDECDPEAE